MSTDQTTRDRRDTDRICITCGKLGGACRWTDDAEGCMRKQLSAARSAFYTLENEARRFAEMYPQSSDGRNTFVIFADKIVEAANVI